MSASQSLIANELLAFLQQKLDVMDEVSAIQICSTGFSVQDILVAKETLYKLLKLSGSFIPHRRGDDDGKRTLQDIIKVLKETEPDDVPTFVAKDLNKLPPVTFDHVDVTRLLKDIVILKASLADIVEKFEVSQTTIADLRKEVDNLRNHRHEIADSSHSSKVDRHVAERQSRPTYASTVMQSQHNQPANRATANVMQPPPPLGAPLQSSNPIHSRPPAARRPTASHQMPKSKSRAMSSQRKDQVDNEGFTLVQKKSKVRREPRKSQRGTATIDQTTVVRGAAPNTALYVSRLHRDVTTNDVEMYVSQRVGYMLKVSPLKSSHYVHFVSCVVHVPNSMLDTIASPAFWPEGVVFRRFRGTLRVTENTSPSSSLRTAART